MSKSASIADRRCCSHDNGVWLAVRRIYETLLQYCH